MAEGVERFPDKTRAAIRAQRDQARQEVLEEVEVIFACQPERVFTGREAAQFGKRELGKWFATLDPSEENSGEECEQCGGKREVLIGKVVGRGTRVWKPCPDCSDPSGEEGEERREAVEVAWEESGRSALDEMFEAVTPRDGSEGDLFTAAMLAPHAWAEIKRLRSTPLPIPPRRRERG